VEYKVHLDDISKTIDIPEFVPSNSVFSISIDGRPIKARWQKELRTLFVAEHGEDLWRPLRVRAKSLTKFPGESEVNFSFEFSSSNTNGITLSEGTVAHFIPGQESKSGSASKKPKVVRSQMTGKIVRILKKEGELVEAGDTILIIEAMKMENRITSSSSGKMGQLLVSESQSVTTGTELFRLL
jgi:biotin carboxyl carrier protein